MCSPHFQTQNDDISWFAEKNIIYPEWSDIGYEVRIPFQCASKKIRVIRRVDQNIFPKKSTSAPKWTSYVASFNAFRRGVTGVYRDLNALSVRTKKICCWYQIFVR